MPPCVRKTRAALAVLSGPLRRSPRIAEKQRRHDEEVLRCAEAAGVQAPQAPTTVQTLQATESAATEQATAVQALTIETAETVQATPTQAGTVEIAAETQITTTPATITTQQHTQQHKTALAHQPAHPGPCLAADTRPAADYLQSLLPGGLFFGYAAVADEDQHETPTDTDRHRPIVWSVAREQALLRAHWDADRRRLLRQHHRLVSPAGPAGPYGPGLLDAELGLWAVLQHRFRCGLDDLFRYGLRPDPNPGAFVATAAAAASAATRYCRKLITILAHPLWTPADLAAMRWLLQRVVQARMSAEPCDVTAAGPRKDHPAPIVPPYAYSRPPFVDTARHWASAVDRRLNGAADAADTASTSTSASAAAAEAEAELTWFFFSANAPRDLYLLSSALDDPEADAAVLSGRMSTTVLGYPDDNDDSDDNDDNDDNDDSDDDDDDDDDDDADADAKLLRRLLRVRTTICYGGLGSIDAHANPSCEIYQRYSRRQLADRHAQMAAAAAAAASNSPPDTRPDDQVLFLLQERDLDHLISLMASPDFLDQTGFAPPAQYAANFAHYHAMYGRGAGAAHPSHAAPPTCNLCLMAFHNEPGDDSDGDHGDQDSVGPGPLDKEDPDGVGDHNHKDNSPFDVPDHVHYFHQHYLRDIPPQYAIAWLLERKGAWLLAARREEAIWRERQQRKEAGGSGGHDVPDIPPFDPSPQAHLDHVFSDPSQLGALMAYRRIGDTHAAERWCFGFGGQT